MKKLRFLVWVILILGASFIGYWGWVHYELSSSLKQDYSREELVEHFVRNELGFTKLVEYFQSKLPPKGTHKITFGIGEEPNTYLLNGYPLNGSISKSNPILGGPNLSMNSLVMDSALKALGWSREVVINLSEKLSYLNCEWISSTEIYLNPIEIFYKKSGWGGYSYLVFDKNIATSVVKARGKVINEVGLGSRTIISYGAPF